MADSCPRCHAPTRSGATFCPGCGSPLSPVATPAFQSRVWVIGADAACDLRITTETVSGRHCRLLLENGQYWIEDLGSLNGTFLRGQRVTQRLPVEFGAPVTLGRQISMPWPSPAAAAPPVASFSPMPFPVAPQALPAAFGVPPQTGAEPGSRPGGRGALRGFLIGMGLLLVLGGGGFALAGHQEKNSVAASVERGAGAIAGMFGKESPVGNRTNQAADQKIQTGGALALVGAVMLIAGLLVRKD